MAPKKRARCQICDDNGSKYSCPKCNVLYCSVPCFKRHKGTDETGTEEMLPKPKQLRPLTSLKWPYVPEETAFPDPLKRDDPKPLTLPQYEAIATSPAVRKALAAHPRLNQLLTSIDALRGRDREAELERALGVSPAGEDGRHNPTIAYEDGDTIALRELAEAIEAAVRGDKRDTLGLDWGDRA
ncbi:hypothetical protein PUNSTDRAFT_63454 [Punctularia strigosozonata HHB-11173 SS5]|uniref:uncharacterized protein n=1 Tax=Punctularia strigosozonata (strain HHB-11173) TaxID=741275 RepID=UPI00044165D2|nr:uncharacterized protein PUNSTDRAFT_63454 [Punctularia strigosozonata HHB-11173 SS5]EIN11241.1 hypothetical protein PUNSTDRAFT_63454 [Punctularia strigosozonata HHB-11173 SS5]